MSDKPPSKQDQAEISAAWKAVGDIGEILMNAGLLPRNVLAGMAAAHLETAYECLDDKEQFPALVEELIQAIRIHASLLIKGEETVQ